MKTAWPSEGLESVTACPLCGSTRRTTMHDALVDHAFAVAPGEWAMHRCSDCGGGFLDPRPTQATIGMAYADYYTHQQGGAAKSGPLSRFRRGVAASYANRVYGTRFPHALDGGHVVARLFPRLRRYLDVTYARHLRRPGTAARRLLDVGCGNGEFLLCATAMGWDAEGIDPDAAAVAAATSVGCRARHATLDDSSLVPGSYQQITMSHVIEHVPSPARQVSRCFELLAPGGRLWLETPNIDSLGHAIFDDAWRGLEPPRHLVLFGRKSLRDVLVRAGFERIEFKSHPAVALFMWEGGRSILRRMGGRNNVAMGTRMKRSLVAALVADYFTLIRPASSEFLTCVAHRPLVNPAPAP